MLEKKCIPFIKKYIHAFARENVPVLSFDGNRVVTHAERRIPVVDNSSATIGGDDDEACTTRRDQRP
jgi:hypothetical protein